MSLEDGVLLTGMQSPRAGALRKKGCDSSPGARVCTRALAGAPRMKEVPAHSQFFRRLQAAGAANEAPRAGASPFPLP